ncbi:hypothetical protein Tco_1079888 [Tanacetum coccineum]|uniref:Reverse transcriptase n=1 Tax=Tanacetum coccineum TaxID=301880 RepID=A0ABQ5HV44_9ASTR
MQAAQDRQKSYADRKRKPREFKIGDRVIPKSSPRRRSLELPPRLSRQVHQHSCVTSEENVTLDEPLVKPLKNSCGK